MKMRNLLTGEEREVTEEEFLRALSQADGISVQQVRTDANGVEHVTDLFGGGDDDEIPFWQGGTAPSEEAGKRRKREKARQARAEAGKQRRDGKISWANEEAQYEAWKKEREEEQEGYRKWRDAWDTWVRERKGAERKRDDAFRRKKTERKRELIGDADDQWERVRKQMAEEQASVNAEKAKAEAEKADAAAALAGLGFFQFSEKNQYKDVIRQRDRGISGSAARLREIAKKLETAEQEHKRKLEEAETAVLREEDAIKREIEVSIPLPCKPSFSQDTRFIELAILDELKKRDINIDLNEFLKSIPALKDKSLEEISRMVSRLSAGISLSRFEIYRVAEELAKSASDNIDTAEFRRACTSCGVDPDRFTASDLEQLQGRLNEIT